MKLKNKSWNERLESEKRTQNFFLVFEPRGTVSIKCGLESSQESNTSLEGKMLMSFPYMMYLKVVSLAAVFSVVMQPHSSPES